MPLSQEALTEAREILAELEYRKAVNPLRFHKRLPMQQRFFDDIDVKKKFILGGNRAGKTETPAEYIVRRCEKDKLKVWVCGETYADSVSIQQKKIWDLAPKNKIRYGRWNEITGFPNRKLLFSNKALVTFKSYDQGREAFQSDDVDIIWNDEEVPMDIYREQKMRLIDRDGEMIISMTSLKGVTELVEDIYQDSETIEQEHADLVNESLPRIAQKGDARIYFLWSTENPHINQARLIKEVELMTRQEIKSRVYGIPVNLTGKIYHFNRRVHNIAWDDLPVGPYTLQHVLDPHDRKPWAMIWVAVHKTGTRYVVDEYPFGIDFNEMESDNKTYDDYAKVIRDKEAYLKGFFGAVMKRVVDPNFGNKTVQLAERQGGQAHTTPKQELKKRGFNFIDGIDALEAGHLKVREALHYTINDNEITKQPSLFVVDDCTNTTNHLVRYSRKDIEASDGDVKDKVQVNEKYKDFADCVRYLEMSNPRYFRQAEFSVDERKVY